MHASHAQKLQTLCSSIAKLTLDVQRAARYALAYIAMAVSRAFYWAIPEFGSFLTVLTWSSAVHFDPGALQLQGVTTACICASD